MSSTDRKISRALKWEGHEAGIGKIWNAQRILVRKHLGKFPLGRLIWN
jgi:hypothetical protein